MAQEKDGIQLHTACDAATGCCTPAAVPGESEATGTGRGILRRDFIKAMGLTVGGLAAGLHPPARPASPGLPHEFLVPADKQLDPAWVEALFERGEPEVFEGEELVYVGMPIGGICAGQVYLGGDGKLWLWDIFNEQKEGVVDKTVYLSGQRVRSRDGANFVAPPVPAYPFDQGFALRTTTGGNTTDRRLDHTGFSDIRFLGQYPVAEVTYRDEEAPVVVRLRAFSPFVPLDFEASSYPATVLHYTVENRSVQPVDGMLAGWMENPVALHSGGPDSVTHINTVRRAPGLTLLTCAATQDPDAERQPGQHVIDLEAQPDHGTVSLAVTADGLSTRATASLAPPAVFDALAEASGGEHATAAWGQHLTGGIGQAFTLQPGDTQTVTFIVAWHFPTLYVRGARRGRHYQNRFDSAEAVATDLAANLETLAEATISWRDTWYTESSLPHWFLNRTFINASTLATETCYRFADNRFWAWEGIGCCPGTCTHVWHYAQAVARLFPELERDLREHTDFRTAFDAQSGKIDFRGGLARRDAADGQAGVIMRSYREHQMSADDAFLRRNWPHIKKALEYLIDADARDGNTDGMLEGEQHNTLDAEWFGKIPAIASLYLCALAAGRAMAEDVGEQGFADTCGIILNMGRRSIEALFNGEYFVQIEDPRHVDALGIGTGCYIDNVFGQSWAFQLGLGRLYDEAMITSALASLWRYNFTLDVGPLRASLAPNVRGRPYALAGDAGLLMCTWPKGGKRDSWEDHWQFGYFNECMTGFEYQVAGHMVWEGLLEEGLSIVRAIHGRYHPARRNPYNEVECSDHYARAMASYGVYLAACGYEYHGPKGYLAFAPRLTPEAFQCAFTAAEGWGTFAQQQRGAMQTERIDLKHGRLRLAHLGLRLLPGVRARTVQASLNEQRLTVTHRLSDERLDLTLETPVTLKAGDALVVMIT